jgi:hypothetical protein
MWLMASMVIVLASVPFCSHAMAADSGANSAQSPPEGLEPANLTLWYLRRTIQALQKALDFVQQQYDSVNLDGVIGTRMVEGMEISFVLLSLLLSNITYGVKRRFLRLFMVLV